MLCSALKLGEILVLNRGRAAGCIPVDVSQYIFALAREKNIKVVTHRCKLSIESHHQLLAVALCTCDSLFSRGYIVVFYVHSCLRD